MHFQQTRFLASTIRALLLLAALALVLPTTPADATRPVSSASGTAGTELEQRSGEIQLTGTVTALQTTKTLQVSVTAVSQPSGRTTSLPAARPKTILLDPGTRVFRMVNGDRTLKTLAALSQGNRVLVSGKDAGVGKPLTARTVVILAGTADEPTPNPLSRSETNASPAAKSGGQLKNIWQATVPFPPTPIYLSCVVALRAPSQSVYLTSYHVSNKKGEVESAITCVQEDSGKKVWETQLRWVILHAWEYGSRLRVFTYYPETNIRPNAMYYELDRSSGKILVQKTYPYYVKGILPGGTQAIVLKDWYAGSRAPYLLVSIPSLTAKPINSESTATGTLSAPTLDGGDEVLYGPTSTTSDTVVPGGTYGLVTYKKVAANGATGAVTMKATIFPTNGTRWSCDYTNLKNDYFIGQQRSGEKLFVVNNTGRDSWLNIYNFRTGEKEGSLSLPFSWTGYVSMRISRRGSRLAVGVNAQHFSGSVDTTKKHQVVLMDLDSMSVLGTEGFISRYYTKDLAELSMPRGSLAVDVVGAADGTLPLRNASYAIVPSGSKWVRFDKGVHLSEDYTAFLALDSKEGVYGNFGVVIRNRHSGEITGETTIGKCIQGSNRKPTLTVIGKNSFLIGDDHSRFFAFHVD